MHRTKGNSTTGHVCIARCTLAAFFRLLPRMSGAANAKDFVLCLLVTRPRRNFSICGRMGLLAHMHVQVFFMLEFLDCFGGSC